MENLDKEMSLLLQGTRYVKRGKHSGRGRFREERLRLRAVQYFSAQTTVEARTGLQP